MAEKEEPRALATASREEEAMITWSEIEAEAGDYRDGFVAVFRKYEGKETDEHDARGLAVRVTAASFARHMGIPEDTFRDWLKTRAATVFTPRDRDRTKEELRRATPERKIELIKEAVRSLPAETREDLAFEITSDASRERQQDYSRKVQENQATNKSSSLELVDLAISVTRAEERLVQLLGERKWSAETWEIVEREQTKVIEKAIHAKAMRDGKSFDEELSEILKAGS